MNRLIWNSSGKPDQRVNMVRHDNKAYAERILTAQLRGETADDNSFTHVRIQQRSPLVTGERYEVGIGSFGVNFAFWHQIRPSHFDPGINVYTVINRT